MECLEEPGPSMRNGQVRLMVAAELRRRNETGVLE